MAFVMRSFICLCFFVLFVAIGCADAPIEHSNVLRLATTTSTRDSGLLEVVLPPFETEHGIRIDVVAVGTGKALNLGSKGDADVLLVHARKAEDEFMNAGYGVRREDIMRNRFELLGPVDDPVRIRSMEPSKALQAITASGHWFVSRGDSSGTHQREQLLWQQAGDLKSWPEYIETGQGMGATLIIADELQAYVLCDRGTYLHFKDKIELVPLVSGDDSLRNPYGAIVVDPKVHPAVRSDLGLRLLDYLVTDETQRLIGEYRLGGELLFHPIHSTE